MKYNFLNEERINNRFNTLLINLRSESNSFYDSYLDLLECFTKKIVDDENIQYSGRAIGDIFGNKNFYNFCVDNLKLKNFNLLNDYIKKCNKHKHEKEKTLDITSSINFIREFFEYFNSYAIYKKENTVTFNENSFRSIFGQANRDNKTLNKKVHELLEELNVAYNDKNLSESDMKRMSDIINEKETSLLDVEEQNKLLQIKLDELQDIKINSMENKLNRTIELLLELKDSISVNKTFVKTVGYTIVGDRFDELVEDERIKNGR